MNKLKMNKTTVAMLMAMSTLYGCGGGADDPNPSDAVDTRVTTEATLAGVAVKGRLDSAQISVEQMNNSPITITSGELTDASRNVSLRATNIGFLFFLDRPRT